MSSHFRGGAALTLFYLSFKMRLIIHGHALMLFTRAVSEARAGRSFASCAMTAFISENTRLGKDFSRISSPKEFR